MTMLAVEASYHRSLVMRNPKRFIAGAMCPRCSELDKITMHHTDDGRQVRECVACGYTDAISDTEMTEPEDIHLDTRVNRLSNDDDHTVKQVVFFKSVDED
jgi:uncharacterized metal-binding protein (TIGR02443 family)